MKNLQPELNAVLEILKEAILRRRTTHSKTAFDLKMEAVTRKLMIAGGIGLVLTLVFAVITYLTRSIPFMNTTITVSTFVRLIGLLIEIFVIISMTPGVLKIGKSPQGVFLN